MKGASGNRVSLPRASEGKPPENDQEQQDVERCSNEGGKRELCNQTEKGTGNGMNLITPVRLIAHTSLWNPTGVVLLTRLIRYEHCVLSCSAAIRQGSAAACGFG